jgi:hypothetical protein
MPALRFAVIDLDSNEPMVAFDSIDDANEFLASVELHHIDINAIVDTIEDYDGYRL